MSISTASSRIAIARVITVLALIAWFTAALRASYLGLANEPQFVLWSFIAIPILGFLGAYAVSGSFRAFADEISLTLLVGSHIWRFVGLCFIYAWLTGNLAAGFAIPAGVGDIIVAAGSLALLPTLLRGAVPRRWLLLWNVIGLLDLIAAIALGALYSVSSIGVLHTETQTTDLMTSFPVSLIPTFFVPLFILVHLLIFRRLADPVRLVSLLTGGSQKVA
jgi:hypothetical protein